MKNEIITITEFYEWRRFLACKKGYSLIEIVTTLAIAGIVFAIAAPNFSKWQEKHQIDGQAQKVYFDLLLARTTAIKNNNNVIVTFNSTAETYIVHDDTDSNGAQGGDEAVKSVNLEENIQFAFNTGVTDTDGNTVTAPVSFSGSQTVTFDSKGQASASGSVFLLHANDVGVNSDRARSLTVLQATGAVDYWSYDSSVSPPWS